MNADPFFIKASTAEELSVQLRQKNKQLLLQMIDQLSDEDRKDFFDVTFSVFCKECYGPKEPDEQCHCTNDE